MAAATIRTRSSSSRREVILRYDEIGVYRGKYNNLPALVREAIEAEPCRIGLRMAKLKGLLAKLEPDAEVFPPPMLSAQPSLLYQKLRGGRRRHSTVCQAEHDCPAASPAKRASATPGARGGAATHSPNMETWRSGALARTRRHLSAVRRG